jgi:hypothetical protein
MAKKFYIDNGVDGGEVWRDKAIVKLPPKPPSTKPRLLVLPPVLLWVIKQTPDRTTKYSLFDAKNNFVRGMADEPSGWGLVLADLLHTSCPGQGRDPLMDAYRWPQRTLQREAPKVPKQRVLVQHRWFKEGDSVFVHMIEHPKRSLEECRFIARQEGYYIDDDGIVRVFTGNEPYDTKGNKIV